MDDMTLAQEYSDEINEAICAAEDEFNQSVWEANQEYKFDTWEAQPFDKKAEWVASKALDQRIAVARATYAQAVRDIIGVEPC
jgi:hypothetical protein